MCCSALEGAQRAFEHESSARKMLKRGADATPLPSDSSVAELLRVMPRRYMPDRDFQFHFFKFFAMCCYAGIFVAFGVCQNTTPSRGSIDTTCHSEATIPLWFLIGAGLISLFAGAVSNHSAVLRHGMTANEALELLARARTDEPHIELTIVCSHQSSGKSRHTVETYKEVKKFPVVGWADASGIMEIPPRTPMIQLSVNPYFEFADEQTHLQMRRMAYALIDANKDRDSDISFNMALKLNSLSAGRTRLYIRDPAYTSALQNLFVYWFAHILGLGWFWSIYFDAVSERGNLKVCKRISAVANAVADADGKPVVNVVTVSPAAASKRNTTTATKPNDIADVKQIEGAAPTVVVVSPPPFNPNVVAEGAYAQPSIPYVPFNPNAVAVQMTTVVHGERPNAHNAPAPPPSWEPLPQRSPVSSNGGSVASTALPLTPTSTAPLFYQPNPSAASPANGANSTAAGYVPRGALTFVPASAK